MTKNKLYLVLLVACLSGFLYLIYSINYSESSHIKVCIIKNVTGYPCPSCGTTRAVQEFLKGNLMNSFFMNPFGIIVAILMAIIPLWILFDLIFKKETFYSNYKKIETIIRIRWVAIILIVLVILNWIWNIKKGL
jgi:hypothetical protein